MSGTGTTYLSRGCMLRTEANAVMLTIPSSAWDDVRNDVYGVTLGGNYTGGQQSSALRILGIFQGRDDTLSLRDVLGAIKLGNCLSNEQIFHGLDMLLDILGATPRRREVTRGTLSSSMS